MILVPAKAWYKSRTVWINAALVAVFAVGLIIDNATDLAIPAQWVTILGIVAAVLNFWLRMVTTQPVAAHSGEVKAVKSPPDNYAAREFREV